MIQASRRLLPAIATALTTLAAANPVAAQTQTFPSKPIRFVSATAAGGNTDILNRIIAEGLTKAFGRPVISENRPGGSNTIGTNFVAKSAPDGYTIMMTASVHASNAGFFSDLPYDSLRDFTFITLVGGTPIMLVVNPGLPVNSVKELIALAKAKPATLNYASSGNGSPAHLAGELLNALAGIKLVHVAYKATAQGVTDTMGGTIQIAFPGPSSVLQHIKSGKLKALAVTTSKRSAATPETPTIAETVPGYDTSIWNGVIAPAGVPKPIVTRLNTEIVKVLNQPEVRTKLAGMGVEVETSTPEEFAAYMESEIKKWTKLIKDLDIKVEMER